MGQAALAFRNLLIKAAVFVAMAALLAWAVGGTLFGSHRVNFPAVDWGGREWAAQVIGNGRQPDRVRWCLVSRAGEGPWQVHPCSDAAPWRDMIGPVADANGLRLAVATEQGGSKSWQLLTFTTADAAPAISTLASEPADRRLPPS